MQGVIVIAELVKLIANSMLYLVKHQWTKILLTVVLAVSFVGQLSPTPT